MGLTHLAAEQTLARLIAVPRMLYRGANEKQFVARR
jgi:hypothetical protein